MIKTIGQRQSEEKVRNYFKTMINLFDYFFSELRLFIHKPEIDTPYLLQGLSYSSEFIDELLFGVGVTKTLCPIIEFWYKNKKAKERMFRIKEIDNFFSHRKLDDAEYLTNLIVELPETKKRIMNSKFQAKDKKSSWFQNIVKAFKVEYL